MAAPAPKTYGETVVVALLMSLKAKGGTLAECIKDMTYLDGTRKFASFEHSLRAASRLAGQLNDKKDAGQVIGPADMSGGGASAGTATT
jgi:hypothetical protein